MTVLMIIMVALVVAFGFIHMVIFGIFTFFNAKDKNPIAACTGFICTLISAFVAAIPILTFFGY